MRLLLVKGLRVVILLVAISAAVFAATELLPGDAADTAGGGRASAAQLAELRAEHGLDRPAWERWGRWAWALAHGDPGRSLLTGRSVADLVALRLPATAVLAGSAFALTVLLTLLGCALAGRRALRRPGDIGGGLATALTAVPQVVVAAGLAALLSGVLGWVPPVSLLPPGGSPLADPVILVLPVLTLALPSAAYGVALLGGAVADALRAPHVADALIRGVPTGRILRRQVLPVLAGPALRVLAVVAGGFTAGSALVETVFGYAGAGELLVSSVAARDTPVVQLLGLGSAAVVLAVLLLADLAPGRSWREGTSS
ncbi:ABC transporter permease [Nonomuraea jabiensis]|uniref:Peptide/nickel transport system permease protein n=1 Tax=Nonomuraea jabiensis TaxID=882448 RepID=A0A7W9LF71_9ACTN|nr:ABC transporter permease [Nonomuraea jabiensis]MBB5781616.1 peptide/nickel transport system permease protein [Nonomuraea jabiensis]